MKYLLDTHVWIWLLEAPDNLSASATDAINSQDAGVCGVSDISAWEIARKESLGRLRFSITGREWLEQACSTAGIEMLRIDAQIAWESCHLPEPFHRDPADQIIAATARLFGLTIITCDHKFLDYPDAQTLW